MMQSTECSNEVASPVSVVGINRIFSSATIEEKIILDDTSPDCFATDNNNSTCVAASKGCCTNHPERILFQSCPSRKRPLQKLPQQGGEESDKRISPSPQKSVRFNLCHRHETLEEANEEGQFIIHRQKRLKGTDCFPQDIAADDETSASFEDAASSSSIWWSRQELAQIRSRNKQCVLNTRERSPDSVKNLVQLFHDCGEDDFSIAGAIQESSLGPTYWGQARGLEYGLDRSISQSRSTHVRTVIMMQEKLVAAHQSSRAVVDLAARSSVLLRRLSLKMSRKTRKFSRILAHFDSMEVLSMLQKELAR